MSREDAEHSYIVLIKQFANVLMNERSLLLAGARHPPSPTCTYAHLPTHTHRHAVFVCACAGWEGPGGDVTVTS